MVLQLATAIQQWGCRCPPTAHSFSLVRVGQIGRPRNTWRSEQTPRSPLSSVCKLKQVNDISWVITRLRARLPHRIRIPDYSMARKGKKKRRNKNSTRKLTSMTKVVPKATTSRKLMRLWQDAILRDEVVDLKQRLQKAQGERDNLRKRASEREDQQEAVFDTLKERVIVAQSEIQVRVCAVVTAGAAAPSCPCRFVVACLINYYRTIIAVFWGKGHLCVFGCGIGNNWVCGNETNGRGVPR